MSRISSRLTFANVVSVLALFVALGSSATAAVLITGKNVKNNSLTGADIKNNSIASADVKDRSLLAKDFKPGQLVSGAPGPQGPKGDTGTVDTSNFYDKSASDQRFLGKTAVAADAAQLGGRDANAYRTGTGAATAGYVNVSSCGSDTLASYPITLTTPSQIVAFGTVGGEYDTGSHQAYARVDLLSGGTVVAHSGTASTSAPNNQATLVATGVMLSATGSATPYNAAPGTYTLRLVGDNSGLCSGYVQYQGIQLSHVALPS